MTRKPTRDEIATAYERVQLGLTYPALDDLHAIYDYLSEQELALRKAARLIKRAKEDAIVCEQDDQVTAYQAWLDMYGKG